MLEKINTPFFKFTFGFFVVLFSLFFATKVDFSALYYGDFTSQFPQSGFMFADVGGGRASQCGLNYVSDRVAITAAHCLDGVFGVYAGQGQYREGFGDTAPSVDYYDISPNYSEEAFRFQPGVADVGVVVFDESVNISEYGFVTSPEAGCGYYLVGYGKNQEGSDFRRTGTDVCIKNIASGTFELDFEGNSHFCNGDSGSGIYEKGTNNIVGVVSAYFTPIGTSGCENGVAFIVTRLDSNLDYLSQHIPESAYVEAEPEIETQVPEDYLENEYPETQSPDGGFNYENEILIMIEELNETFKNIYPEEEDGDTDMQTTPFPTVEFNLDTDSDDEGDILPPNSTGDPGDEVDFSGLIFICGILLCCLSLILAVVVLVVIKSKKKKEKQQTQQMSQSQNTIGQNNLPNNNTNNNSQMPPNNQQ